MSNSRDITEYENSSPQRLIWFVAIAGIGCLTAIPFRRSVPPSADMGAANSAQTSTPFARVSDIRGGAIADDAYLPPSVPFAGQAAPETVDSILVDVPQPLPSRGAISPPTIPAAYEPLVKSERTEPSFLQAQEEQTAQVLPKRLQDLAQSQPRPVQNHRRPIQARHQEVTVQIPPRPYRIRDRDTLESIAKRFLGDANRAGELFDQNRGILARPDILPIGQTILIPQ